MRVPRVRRTRLLQEKGHQAHPLHSLTVVLLVFGGIAVACINSARNGF